MAQAGFQDRKRLPVAALAVVAASIAWASPVSAADVALVRPTGSAQFDEAAAAVRAEVGSVVEITIDTKATAADVAEKIRASGARSVIAIGARAAQVLSSSPVPVVACMVLGETVGSPVVTVSLAVAGAEQLTTLKRLAPSVKTVGVIYDGSKNASALRDLGSAARAQGLKIVGKSVPSSNDAIAALEAMLPSVDALLVIPDASVVSKQFLEIVVARAFERRLPVLTYSEAYVKLGLLAALAPSYAANGKRAGALAKRLAAGDSGQEAMQRTEGGLVVNVGTARRIGLSLSPDILQPPTVTVGGS